MGHARFLVHRGASLPEHVVRYLQETRLRSLAFRLKPPYLHRIRDRPPTPNLLIPLHLSHVPIKILALISEARAQQAQRWLVSNRIIDDVGRVDCVGDGRWNRSVQAFVLGGLFGFQANDLMEATWRSHAARRKSGKQGR